MITPDNLDTEEYDRVVGEKFSLVSQQRVILCLIF